MLVVPPGSMEDSYGRLSSAGGNLPMLGLAYIAASLRDQGHQVKIVDFEIQKVAFSLVEPEIRKFDPDLLGMTAYITNMQRCFKMAEITKRINRDTLVILGGPQVSIFPEAGMESNDIDFCVLSEGEIVIRNLLNALSSGKPLEDVKGIVFRDNNGAIVNTGRESLIRDLDRFPPPALDLYDMENYFPPVHVRGKKVGHIMTSRGCPFQCTFCETKLTFGKTFRYHSNERVLWEIENLVSKGFDSIQFYDDIFTVNKKRVLKLCRSIAKKRLKFQWMCWTRTNCVDDEVLQAMKKAGCYAINYGAESGNDELLKLIKKSLTVKENLRGIQLAKKHGILTNSSFMLGLPTETRQQSFKTIRFALNSGLDYAVFPILEPYPGTALWNDVKKYGYFDDSGKYKNNLMSNVSSVWIPNGRSREELERIAYMAMKKFYLRPKQINQSIKNFIYLPPKRAFRYIKAGITFFVLSYSKSSKGGTRY